MIPEIINSIFNIKKQDDFQKTALEIFKYQADNNPVYRNFINLLGIDPATVASCREIPFLPAGFFKLHKIITGSQQPVIIFESSGTSDSPVSKHYIVDPLIYEESFSRTFRLFYGDPAEYFIAALLPSYTERKSSSLVYMVGGLIKKSAWPDSGFYKEKINELLINIKTAKSKNRKVLLIGVSFALLDLAEQYAPDLSGVIVMETGGMKGRRNEITRGELHSILKKSYNLQNVHSEYGMTELLSQAYSKADGIYFPPPWMKILIRDPQDPLSVITEPGKTGGINIIDLANIYSCSFIATDDLGKLHEGGSFEVLGRIDNSDIRGCNQMIE
ncbi:MAG: acyl transferase [Bacteroidia bacterium]|nr:acyl transferase [Bacteroidia bacterium]